MRQKTQIQDDLVRVARPSAWLMTIIIASLLCAALFLLPRLNLIPFDADHWTADWRTALLSPRAEGQDGNVALVLINDETLDGYPYVSPIDRGLIAKLIDTIDRAGAKAIGLDIVFDRPSEPAKDGKLVSALKNAQATVVLGVVNDNLLSDKQKAFQAEFIANAGRSVGHVHFLLKGRKLAIDEDTIREIPPPLSGRQSFSWALAKADGEPETPASNLIAWQRTPKDGTDMFLSLPAQVLLAFAGNPSSPLALRMAGQLKDKIVLIGGDFASRDRHPTPLSIVEESRQPGVAIHAQIIAQLIEGRTLWELGPRIEIAILFGLALLGCYLGWRYQIKRLDLLFGLLGTAILVAVDFLAYANYGLILPFATHWQAWVLGVTGGHFVAMLFPPPERSGTVGGGLAT